MRPAQPGAFDGAQIQTGALPTQGGEKLSNLKINVHGAKWGFNKNVNRRLASTFSEGLDAGATRSGRIGQGGSFETGWLGTMGVELLGLKRALEENCRAASEGEVRRTLWTAICSQRRLSMRELIEPSRPRIS